jgi:hypothetical protein
VPAGQGEGDSPQSSRWAHERGNAHDDQNEVEEENGEGKEGGEGDVLESFARWLRRGSGATLPLSRSYSVGGNRHCTSGHAPWPRGSCTKCQPQTVMLERQPYRHVGLVDIPQEELGSFMHEWEQQSRIGRPMQRIGLLYGMWEKCEHDETVMARVFGIFEPPQHSEGGDSNGAARLQLQLQKAAEVDSADGAWHLHTMPAAPPTCGAGSTYTSTSAIVNREMGMTLAERATEAKDGTDGIGGIARSQAQVDAICGALGLTCLGCIITKPPSAEPGPCQLAPTTRRRRRLLPTYRSEAQELMAAARFQLLHPYYDPNMGGCSSSRFVTVVASKDPRSGRLWHRAFMATDLCMALTRDQAIEAYETKNRTMAIRGVKGLPVVGEDGREIRSRRCPSRLLQVPIPCGDAATDRPSAETWAPAASSSSILLRERGRRPRFKHVGFCVENRERFGVVQTAAAAREYLLRLKRRGEPPVERLSDFHLLLFLPRILGIVPAMSCCEALRNGRHLDGEQEELLSDFESRAGVIPGGEGIAQEIRPTSTKDGWHPRHPHAHGRGDDEGGGAARRLLDHPLHRRR